MHAFDLGVDDGVIKARESAETLTISVTDDGKPYALKDDDKLVFKIGKNNKWITSLVPTRGEHENELTLPTKALSSLPADVYQLELWVTHADSSLDIFPDNDFLELDIEENLDGDGPKQITSLTLKDFNQMVESTLEKLKNNTGTGEGGHTPAISVDPKTYQLIVDGKDVGPSLRGAPGKDAHTPTITVDGTTYQLVVDGQATGPSLQGKPGKDGDPGQPGKDGDPGKPGSAATITVGSTSTAEPGTNASVTNTGDDHAAVLNFTIPKGEKGDPGQPGTTPSFAADPVVKQLPAGSAPTLGLTQKDGTYTLQLGLDKTLGKAADTSTPSKPSKEPTAVRAKLIGEKANQQVDEINFIFDNGCEIVIKDQDYQTFSASDWVSAYGGVNNAFVKYNNGQIAWDFISYMIGSLTLQNMIAQKPVTGGFWPWHFASVENPYQDVDKYVWDAAKVSAATIASEEELTFIKSWYAIGFFTDEQVQSIGAVKKG